MDQMNSETQTDILLQKACSDPAAFAKLYRLHYDQVFRYCSRRLFNRHAAEDVTSTVFFKVMNSMGTFKGDIRDFRNWLYRIATNAANDHLRSSVRRAEAMQSVAQNTSSGFVLDVSADVDLEDKKLLLKKAVLSLKPKYQTVIALRFFENMKLIKIAEILGQKPATVRSQLNRGLEKLRKKLKAAGAVIQ